MIHLRPSVVWMGGALLFLRRTKYIVLSLLRQLLRALHSWPLQLEHRQRRTCLHHYKEREEDEMMMILALKEHADVLATGLLSSRTSSTSSSQLVRQVRSAARGRRVARGLLELVHAAADNLQGDPEGAHPRVADSVGAVMRPGVLMGMQSCPRRDHQTCCHRI